jgi:hypothetical protein
MKRVLVVMTAVVAVTAGAIYLARPRRSGPDPKAWEAKAAVAFRPLVADIPGLVAGASQWLAGQGTAADIQAQIDNDRRDFSQSRDRLAALRPSPKVPETGELYWRSAQLYVEVTHAYGAMVATEPGNMRTQFDLLARRTRELADRIYDRGHAAISPYLDKQQPKDVEIRLPEEVPIWTDEGLAAGPPLDLPPPPAADAPPLRQATRPEESDAAWRRDVRLAGAPNTAELRAGIARRDQTTLRALADRFVTAAETLRGRPDPRGNREKGATLRLSWLVEAEAARGAQAALITTGAGAQLAQQVGSALAGIGAGIREQVTP